jgi:hypothetical protein
LLAAIDITQDIDEKLSTVKDLPCQELVQQLETYGENKMLSINSGLHLDFGWL